MRSSSFRIGVLLFAISLAAKLPYLGTFLTIDEPRWIRGAGQFLMALQSGDLAQTYWHFHPGITITWGEAIILWLQSIWATDVTLETFVEFQMDNLALSVGAMRFSGVLLTSLTLPIMYGLAKPLLGKWPAILGVGLLAVDPFWVAHSRVVNGDALTAVLMIVSFLSFASLLTKPTHKLAIISGIFAGLSFLTKLPSQILIPCIALLAIIGYLNDRNWRFWLKALILCGLSATVVFIVLWPAMWVAPVNTLTKMFEDTFGVGDIGGRDKVKFFMGEVRAEQSQFFYPLALLFRLTPINLIGSVLALGLILTSQKLKSRRTISLLFVYIIIVVVLANVSPKKADRYALSVVPAINLLAGVGWIWLSKKIAEISIAKRPRADGEPTEQVWRMATLRTRYLPVVTTGLIFGQFIFVFLNYPYVLTYYNPLLGGYAKAVEMVPVGRGEGLEKAAAWINSQPDAQSATTSPYYENVTNPYLLGKSLGFSDTGHSQILANYSVFYITQTQRKLPYPGMVDYFQKKPPVYVVSYGKTPYVWVYKRELLIKKLRGRPEIVGRAALVGYHLSEANLTPGSSATFILYLLTKDQYLPDNEDFKISLLDAHGNEHGVWQGAADNEWLPDSVIEWKGQLSLPATMEPGDYKLKVSLMDTNLNAEVTFFPFKDELITVGP